MRKGLLLGAGFSYDLGMPLTVELTDLFLDPFNARSAKDLGDVLAAKDPYSKGRPINAAAIHEGLQLVLAYKAAGKKNYEELLGQLQRLGDTPGKSQSDRDSYNYLFGVLYELVFSILFAYQRESYQTLYAINGAHFALLRNLLSEHETTWVFTLNHDLYLECLALDHRIPITYGDSGELEFPISNDRLDQRIRLTCAEPGHMHMDGPGWLRGVSGINCVRLHGGIAELQYKDRALLCNPSLKGKRSVQLIAELTSIESMGYYHRGERVPSGRDRVVTGPDGRLDIIRRAMLTGGKKYSKTTSPKKGEEKLQLFDEVLRTLDELTVVGYGFGDGHVNVRISNAMVLNRDLKVRIVDPKWRRCPEILEQFGYGSRVLAACCRAPEWMTYVEAQQWDPSQSKALRDSEVLRAQVKEKIRTSWQERPA